jgi:hypothetical protein
MRPHPGVHTVKTDSSGQWRKRGPVGISATFVDLNGINTSRVVTLKGSWSVAKHRFDDVWFKNCDTDTLVVLQFSNILSTPSWP